MKTFPVAILFFFLLTTMQGQVVLEKTYNYSTSVVKFETFGYKYYLMDVPQAQCRIYNPDHSQFRIINCHVPDGFFLYDIKFLSENLFDNDPGIELLCTFYRYNATPDYTEYDSKIIQEDGSQITFIDGALYNYIHQTGENEYKLFSYCYDFSVWPEKVWTSIYRLPGIPVATAFMNDTDQEMMLKAFPNPAEDAVEVAYTLPSGVRDGTLFLFNSSAQLVDQYDVDNHTDHLLLDVSGLRSGMYHYYLQYGNRKSGTKKLLVQ